MNALGYVTGGPLPNQVMLSRWFDAGRGKAMGIAYLGIGVGGALVPLLAHALTEALGWRTALQVLGVLMIAIAFPLAFFVREPEAEGRRAAAALRAPAAGAAARDSILRRPAPARLLPARPRQHGLDRGGGRHDPEPEALLRHGPGHGPGPGRGAPLARARREHRGAPADGLAGRPLAPEAGDAPHLPDRRRAPSRSSGRRPRRSPSGPPPSSSASASAATT